jgi:hypothetical protein
MLQYSKLKCLILHQLIIFWIEILIFGLKSINLEFKYQNLDEISLFKFKLKISYLYQNFEIQITF